MKHPTKAIDEQTGKSKMIAFWKTVGRDIDLYTAKKDSAANPPVYLLVDGVALKVGSVDRMSPVVTLDREEFLRRLRKETLANGGSPTLAGSYLFWKVLGLEDEFMSRLPAWERGRYAK